jgi:hypothetical protein
MADEMHPPSAAALPLRARRDIIVSCWLCGIRRHASQMVPDGGRACPDVRWYCKDARACTDRWTIPPPEPKGVASAGAAANRARRNARADAAGAAASEGTSPDAEERTGTREQAASPGRAP